MLRTAFNRLLASPRGLRVVPPPPLPLRTGQSAPSVVVVATPPGPALPSPTGGPTITRPDGVVVHLGGLTLMQLRGVKVTLERGISASAVAEHMSALSSPTASGRVVPTRKQLEADLKTVHLVLEQRRAGGERL